VAYEHSEGVGGSLDETVISGGSEPANDVRRRGAESCRLRTEARVTSALGMDAVTSHTSVL